MKKILFIFFILILVFLLLSYKNNPRAIISRLADRQNIQFRELKYKVYLVGILPVGEIILGAEKTEAYKGEKVYHLKATGQTSKYFSKVFTGHFMVDSYLDREDFNPVFFKQKIEATDKPNREREISYDHKNNIMFINGNERSIFPNTQDPLSALFNIQHMDFDRAREFEININSSQKNYILKGASTPKDLLIGKRIYKIARLKTEVARRSNNPYHNSNVSMTLLRGKVNIPIKVTLFASGVLINARLVDIK